MTKTELAGLFRVKRQREVTPKSNDAVSINDRGSIMANGMGIKNAFQERLAQEAIQRNSSFQVPVERIFPLDDNKRSNPLLRKVCNSVSDRVYLLMVKWHVQTFSDFSPHGEALEESAEFFLEDHHKGNQENGKETLEDYCGQIKLKKTRENVHHAEQTDSDQDKPGGCFPKPN
jgi:hypothetical protein